MKTLIIAAAMSLGLATVSSADGLAYVAGAEYAIEAETFEVTAGVEYGVSGFTFAPLVTLNDAGQDFDFASAELTVSYGVSANLDAYVTVESDADFDYAETTLGVALKF
jgi:hypothetical protein